MWAVKECSRARKSKEFMKTQYKNPAGRFPRRGLWAERSGGLLCQMRGQLFDLLSRSIYVGLIYPREIGRYHTLFKVVNFTVQVVFLEKGHGSLGAGFQTPAMSYALPGVRLRGHRPGG